ncbi:hypothetical protein HW49_07490 [Porphyromonadaceae bacterium COT-184 OH4590]|nr:hypothetical protein HW49_07490 [Porphyromonadaceae bacterium COT-184 OH4590]
MPDLTLSSHKHLGQFIFFLHKDTYIYLISNTNFLYPFHQKRAILKKLLFLMFPNHFNIFFK